MNAKKWALREKISDDLEKQILFHRGIKTEEEAKIFLNPDYDRDLRDPYELPAMGKIVERIVRAVSANERIIVYGDYDADGICACAIFHDFFKKIGYENFDVYIPDRLDGYGLNFKAIEEIVKQKAKLIITVDCGITDKEEIEMINKEGLDVIVTDHHLPSKGAPSAFAALDLFMEGNEYPFKFFCGAGLAFKVVAALCKNEKFQIIPGWEKWFLDIASIATIADLVPLAGENRVLVRYGLEVMKKTRRKGLLSLYNKLQVSKPDITEEDVGFSVAPCINVASRMEHATISYSLLTTNSSEEAENLSQKVVEMNNERKHQTENIFTEINRRLEGKENLPEILVLGDEKWPIGILAPLCNKVLEKYERSAIVWGKGEISPVIRGSCRSNGRINLVDLLTELGEDFFSEFGGHAFSTAFTLKKGKSADLEKEIVKAYEKISHFEVEPPCLWLDAELALADVDWHLIEILDKFRPFGMGNQKPVFLLKNLEVFEARTFGNGGIHLKLNFRKTNGEFISAIGFFADKFFPACRQAGNFPIEKGTKVDLAASVEKNIWNGNTELRMRIFDIKKAQ